jgi:hypothetical protein
MKVIELVYLLFVDWLDERNFVYEQNYWNYCFHKDRFELMLFSLLEKENKNLK